MCSDGTIYCGSTNDVNKRVLTHNNGKGAKYTRSRRPVELVWWKQASGMSAAFKEEYRIKHLTREQKLDIILEYRLDSAQ